MCNRGLAKTMASVLDYVEKEEQTVLFRSRRETDISQRTLRAYITPIYNGKVWPRTILSMDFFKYRTNLGTLCIHLYIQIPPKDFVCKWYMTWHIGQPDGLKTSVSMPFMIADKNIICVIHYSCHPQSSVRSICRCHQVGVWRLTLYLDFREG